MPCRGLHSDEQKRTQPGTENQATKCYKVTSKMWSCLTTL